MERVVLLSYFSLMFLHFTFARYADNSFDDHLRSALSSLKATFLETTADLSKEYDRSIELYNHLNGNLSSFEEKISPVNIHEAVHRCYGILSRARVVSYELYKYSLIQACYRILDSALKSSGGLSIQSSLINQCEKSLDDGFGSAFGISTFSDVRAPSEISATVQRQLEHLDERAVYLKLAAKNEKKREVRVRTALQLLRQTSTSEVWKLYNFDIPRKDPTAKVKPEWKGPLDQRLTTNEVGKELRKYVVGDENTAIRDIASLDNSTFMFAFYVPNKVWYMHEDGRLLGQLLLPWRVFGLAAINSTHVILGLPYEQRAIVVVANNPIRITSEVKFDGGCPRDIAVVGESYVVSCDEWSVRLYDKHWNRLKRVGHPPGYYFKSLSWVSFNPVTRIVMVSDENYVFGYTLEGHLVFIKGQLWVSLQRPLGICGDEDGNWYAADKYKRRIAKFSPSGTFMGHIITTWAQAVDTFGEKKIVHANMHKIVQIFSIE